MRYETVQVPIGEPCGPIDWDHPAAKDKPAIWREAEASPGDFLYNGRAILRICMYDGWPYWKPMPAIQFIGPLKSGEWDFFNSYGAYANSITRQVERELVGEIEARAEGGGVMTDTYEIDWQPHGGWHAMVKDRWGQEQWSLHASEMFGRNYWTWGAFHSASPRYARGRADSLEAAKASAEAALREIMRQGS